MSKIICDICGTAYPENANACPICGFPRKDAPVVGDEEVGEVGTAAVAATATPRTKGGRFSNKNVKKRNQAAASGETRRERKHQSSVETENEEEGSNRGLVITVIILAIAVLLMGIYIGMRFWNGRDAYDNPGAPVIGTNPSTDGTSAPTEPEETGIPCAGLTISDASVEFLGTGRGWKLSVSTAPADTTDELTFSSSDENVVTVTSDGRLTSVGPGTAIITITCGDVVKECQVVCNFDEETEPAETTQPEETTEPEETTKPTEADKTEFKLDRNDVSLFTEGESFTFGITSGGSYVSPASVTWSSKDPSVATVNNGKVTAVGGGTTTIVATYNGTTQECIVRCRFETGNEPEETTKPTEPDTSDAEWSISHTDVTISVGESFSLRITDASGVTASVSWSASVSGIVAVNGNTVTGTEAGNTTLTATVNGQTFSCIVRVK